MNDIEVNQITKKFGNFTAVDGISFAVEHGEIFALLGPNGAGKSTLIRMLTTLIPTTSGSAKIQGFDVVKQANDVRRVIGVIPQAMTSDLELSVEENLLVAERSPDRHGWNLQRVYKLFPRLHERRNQRAKTLSGGEQQMLAIGRALMTNPDCLIMDEPSEGLAPIIIQGLWEAISTLKKEGLSILLVEQNAHLALKLVDYVHVMSKGQVVYSAKPEELRANDEIKASYLGI